MTRGIFWIIAISLLSGILARYEDCESPPSVDFATVRLEDEEDRVRAIYACHSGYTLKGDTEIECDLDTDEWNADPPTCIKMNASDDNDEDNNIGDSNSRSANQQKKKKTPDIPEDPLVTSDYAENLDMTCVSARVKAPEIRNGFVQKYDRRRKGDNIFLVAFYSCNDNYELEDSDHNVVYCSKKKWIGELPVCIAMSEYEEEDYDGYDEGGEGVEEEEENEENPPNVHEPPETESSTEVKYTVAVSGEETDLVTTTSQAVTDVNIVVEPTADPYTPRLLNESCGDDKGGCEHNCEKMLYPGENEPRIVCSCSSGFTLDPYDFRRCHDIDECDIDNGGCEQICTNTPGSFECSCRDGLQLDMSTRKTCIDVNECLLRNGHGPCQDTCINTWGSYRCSCNGLPGTKLSADRISCEDSGVCALNNGGCSHICLSTIGRIFCLCPKGFLLSRNWKTCKDINECDSAEIAERCPGGCENTPGSFVCHPSPIADPKTNEVESSGEDEEEPEQTTTRPLTLVCEEGYRLTSDGNCVDIDECKEGIARCENCRNRPGSYDCLCPAGYELGDDEISCVDINECEAYANEEENNESSPLQKICSHKCENTPGSFVCKCADDHHLDEDRRSCIPDVCDDWNEATLDKTPCSHYCEDTADGPVCRCPDNFELGSDGRTCKQNAIDPCLQRGGKEQCFPGSCVPTDGNNYKCICPAGFKDDIYSCKDIDECTTNTHNCSHICFNTEGSFVCSCPLGFKEVNGDPSVCRDVDECVEKDNVCGNKVCQNVDGGFDCVCPDGTQADTNGECVTLDLCSVDKGGCSHECSSFDGQRVCQCPVDMTLSSDGVTCVLRNVCADNNNGCSQVCNSHLMGECSCEAGYELQEDGKSCRDYDECIDNNGGCEHICVNKPGAYECFCRRGFVLLSDTCIDIDECALDTHNCAPGLLCHNLDGSYACNCPLGFALAENSSTECLDLDECSENNGNCSDVCINLRGSFECACPLGLALLSDNKTCDHTNECLINNGGCSHICIFDKSLTTCSCPSGFALNSDGKTCSDINECTAGVAECSHKCNNNLGGFSCACREGFSLAENGRDCSDIDECVDNNGNCSNICINLLGSFSCACEAGFELKEDLRTCTDVDECLQSLHECSHNCINNLGGYDCSCPSGFVLSPNKLTCIDVDECSGFTGCSHNCRNTLGSFDCECPSGLVLAEDKRNCIHGDYCSAAQCSHDCINIDGGFRCTCPTGMVLGSDSVTCVSLEDCLINNGGCSHHCATTDGSVRCFCPIGYKLGDDGRVCQDINECEIDNGRCDHYCINTEGSYSCECNDGYFLQDDRISCAIGDACKSNNGGCDQICTNFGVHRQCSCRPGFVLNADNTTCSDINECLLANTCPGKNCRNTIGSYECFCNQGYTTNIYGDCVDINECGYQNGGCPGECINLSGSFECKCPRGLRYSSETKSCVEIRDYCQPFRPPQHGEIHCTRSRHKTQLFYRTKCSVWCLPGYKLEGPPIRHCSVSGQWDNYENRCIPQSCPPIPRAQYGTILPTNCLLGDSPVGQRCMLHCNPGFMPSGKKAVFCTADQRWSYNSTFDCIPFGTPILNAPPRRVGDIPRLGGIRTYIKCPRNTTVLLPAGHSSAHIILHKPKTNIDYRYVESYPAWSRNLEAHLGPGVHIVTFRARHPHARRGVACRTVITVKTTVPPKVIFCPTSFEVSLAIGQERRSVAWQEPEFQSENQIKNIYKSHIPGQLFGEGVHGVLYEATDIDGQASRCEFNVVVKAPLFRSIPYTYGYPQVEQRSSKLLANHDSYIICTGQTPVKIYGPQPVSFSSWFFKTMHFRF